MPAPTPLPNTWHAKLIAMARNDPKKAGVLGLLVLVLAGMWAWRALGDTPGPRGAQAALTSSNQAHGAQADGAAKAAGVLIRSTANRDRLEASGALQEWVRKPIAPLGRNVFAVNLDYFPQDGSKLTTTLRAPVGDGFWDDLAKSMTAQADQRKERQILVENLQLRAGQLQLQTTLMDDKPKALIDGQMVGEGGVVAGFPVLKIEARRIIVECEGVKLEIQMK